MITCQIVKDHLKALVKQHYDAATADALIRGAAKEPSWLPEIMKKQDWRRVFYDLNQKHKGSSLLTYIMKRLHDLGYQRELVTMGVSSCTLECALECKSDVPRVFMDVLCQAIKAAIESAAKTSSDDMQELAVRQVSSILTLCSELPSFRSIFS